MRNSTVSNIVGFISFVFLQVFILNHVDFLGYVNPYLYIIFILFLPIGMKQWKVLILSFLLGLVMDIFDDSGGIHTSACLVIAYFRPFFLQTSFGLSFDNRTINFYRSPFKERFLYILLMVLVHHLVLFSLVFFDFSHVFLILKNVIFSGIFTSLLIMITMVLLRRSK